MTLLAACVVAQPVQSLPSPKDVRAAPEATYVILQVSPLPLYERCDYYATLVPMDGHKRRVKRFPGSGARQGTYADSPALFIFATKRHLPKGWQSPYKPQDDPLFTGKTKKLTGVIVAQIEPGDWSFSSIGISYYSSVATSSYSTTSSAAGDIPIGSAFEAKRGQVIYLGSYSLTVSDRQYDPHTPIGGTAWTDTIRVQTIDNLPALLAILDVFKPGLGQALGERHIRTIKPG